MKRNRTLFAAFAVLSLLAAPAFAQQCGDVNDDGRIAASDALAVLRKAVGQNVDLVCVDSCAVLEPRLAALEALLAHLTVEGENLVLTGMNFQVVNGSGSSTGEPNGTGNIIIGYDEGLAADDKSGSHNLVIGPYHSYSSVGGLVAGEDNAISAEAAVVVGGEQNLASAPLAVVAGGFRNEAGGQTSSVAGGEQNFVSGRSGVISGGTFGLATGNLSAIAGGSGATASGEASTVGGGKDRAVTQNYEWRAGSLIQAQ